MPTIRSIFAALATATVGLGLVAVSPVAANAATVTHFLHPAAIGVNGTITAADSSQLSSIAGYGVDMAADTSAGQWKASMTFRVPTVRCARNTTDPIFIELFFDGVDKNGNTLFGGGDVIITCDSSGRASYSTNVSAEGGATGGVDGSASPGDVITVDAKASHAAEVSTVTNVTTGQVTSQTGLGWSGPGGTQASLQAGFGTSRFPHFTRVNFSGLRVAGTSFGAAGAYPITATDPAGNVKVSVGPLGSNGTSFVDTFVSDY